MVTAMYNNGPYQGPSLPFFIISLSFYLICYSSYPCVIFWRIVFVAMENSCYFCDFCEIGICGLLEGLPCFFAIFDGVSLSLQ